MMTGTNQEWRLKATPDLSGFPHDSLTGISPLIRQLIIQRGFVDDDDIQHFLNPKLRNLSNPFEMAEMREAVSRIFHAIDNEEAICIYGDYDVDGVTSVSLLYSILNAYDSPPHYFIPIRSQEGYGLSKAGITRCLEECPKQPKLIITVDCGTTSHEEIAFLQTQGIDVIILDHHEPSPLGKPEAVALVNPKVEGSDLTYLCSAGVVFKLIHALLKERQLPHYDLKNYLDLVALATISDIVPLVDENRILVRHGLKQLNSSINTGIQMLKQVAGVDTHLSASHVGFRLGPRINAAGRMDSPMDALDLLLTTSRSDAHNLAHILDDHNKHRQEEETSIKREAIERWESEFAPLNGHVIVLGSRDWHPGVVGIVASQLMRIYHKPTFIIAIDEQGIGKGSGRSIHGISLTKVIQHCKDTLISGGGHDMAAGIVIHEDKVEAFREAFHNYVEQTSSAEDRRPILHIDAEAQFEDLTLDLLRTYELLEPFGNSNPQPVFISKNIFPTEAPRRLAGNHLKFFLRQGTIERDAIFFGIGDTPLPPPPWDIAYTIERNVFRGRTTLSISLRDIRSSIS